MQFQCLLFRTEVCTDPEIVRRYKYTLMLIPINPQVRTYYISVGSERELMVSGTLLHLCGLREGTHGEWCVHRAQGLGGKLGVKILGEKLHPP